MIDGERIMILRRRKNWTQAQLAKACGLHRATVSQVEVGIKTTSLKALARIASALEVETSSLLLDSAAVEVQNG